MVMQFGVGDTGRYNIYHTTNKPYAPTVYPSVNTQPRKLRKSCTSTFEKHPLYELWQYSQTPALVLGGVEVISPTTA